MQESVQTENRRDIWMIAVLMIAGVLMRVAALGYFPAGINQDEAYAAYEAWCLLEGGMDSWGYRLPVYLTAWGSGMNALESYLMVPFVAMFGLETWAIRLPQALLACASLPVMYGLLKRIFDKKTALIGLALLAICPWHITMARWALESNLAPGMILLGLYFFVKGTEHPQYYLASGIAYGLSLYAYATIWVVLPFMLLLHAAYLLYVGKLRFSGWLAAGACVLLLMAAPLVGFLAVNWGLIPEVTTPFFSIPRMPQMRGNEVTFANLYENVYRMVKTFLLQRDDMVWNASQAFGLYYHLSLPFMVIGGIVCVVRSLKSLKTRTFDGCVLILAWLMLGILQGCMIDGNVNRLNYLHFPIILCIVMGIAQACAWINQRWRLFGKGLAAVYACCFLLFAGFYFTEYQQKIEAPYDAGLCEALAYAKTVTDGEICVSDEIIYPKILFYGQVKPQVFAQSVVWRGEPGAFMRIESVDRFRFGVDEATMQGNVCIVKASEISDGVPEGIQTRLFKQVAVVYGADPS